MHVDLRRLVEQLSVLVALITGGIAIFVYLGWFWAGVFGLTAAVALVVWNLGRYGIAVDPANVLLTQLALLSAQLLTFSEMIALDFAHAFSARFPNLVAAPMKFDEYIFVTAFPLTLMSIFMSSAAFEVSRHSPIAFFILCFSAIWAIALSLVIYIGSGVGDVLLPGVWTGIVPMLAGGTVLFRVALSKGPRQ
jgi:hypothetical protein